MARFQKLVIAGIAALVLAVAIVGSVVISQLSQAANQAAYERCLAANGYPLGSPIANEDLEEMLDATASC